MWQGYEDTHKIRGDEGPGSCPPQVSGVQGQLTLTLENWSHTALPISSDATNRASLSGAGRRHGAAQHRWGARWRSLWRDTRGEVNLVTFGGRGGNKPRGPEAEFVEKPRKTKRCVFRWEQSFVIELLSHIPIVQNKHRPSKQNKERQRELYSIVCGHHSLIPVKEGPGGGVVVSKLCLIYCLYFVSKKKNK